MVDKDKDKDKKDDLRWDTEKDFGFDTIHLQCELESFSKESVLTERKLKPNSKFFLRGRSTFSLKNCTPTLKNNETIDKNKRIHIDTLLLITNDTEEKEVDYTKVDTTTKKRILNARLDTIDTWLKDEQDQSMIGELNKNKVEVAEQLKKIEKYEQDEIAKKLLTK